MTGRDTKAILLTLGLLAVAAILIIVVAPNFFASEKPYPARTPTAVVGQASPVASNTPVPAPTPTLVATLAPTNIPAPTAVLPTATLPPITKPANSVPGVKEEPFNLPAGISPSDGAKSCPQPLPVEKIRSDYLDYWNAFKQAYREGKPDLLKPFVDTQARDGKYWQGKQQAIQKTVEGGYYLDYQIEHSDPLTVKINPTFGGPGQCQVSVFDGAKLTISAKKKGTDEPFDKNNPKPYIQQYKSGQSFEMVVRNGRWMLAGEGAGTQ
jgi:hypothetical protein